MRKSMESLFSLDGKVAVLTGGSGGIGRGLARGLAAAGAKLVVAARDAKKIEAVTAEVRADFDCEALGVVADVRKPGDIDGLVHEASRQFGRIDIVVANAGIAVQKLPQELSVEEWDEEMNTNVRHTFLLAKAAYPFLVKGGGGKIITLGSMTSIFGIAALPSYGASKGGVVQLTRSLATAWAADNIQVNCIMPGFIDPGLAGVPRKQIPGFDEAVAQRTPAGRWGEPADLAGAVVFLSSRASDFITGAAIPIDGGYAIQG